MTHIRHAIVRTIPNPVGRPLKHLGGTMLSRKYGLSIRVAVLNRLTLVRLPLMKPEARRYMLKLIREGRH